tara:strand:- start:405 stop:695 length:291 start_codon:yes stop_codon:yes gene_type:complete
MTSKKKIDILKDESEDKNLKKNTTKKINSKTIEKEKLPPEKSSLNLLKTQLQEASSENKQHLLEIENLKKRIEWLTSEIEKIQKTNQSLIKSIYRR